MTARICARPRDPTTSHLTCATTPAILKSCECLAAHASRKRIARSSVSVRAILLDRSAMGFRRLYCTLPRMFPPRFHISGQFSLRSCASFHGNRSYSLLRRATSLLSPSFGKLVGLRSPTEPRVSTGSESFFFRSWRDHLGVSLYRAFLICTSDFARHKDSC